MAVGAYPIAVNVNTGDLSYDAAVGGPMTPNLLTTGEETFPREFLNSTSSVAPVSQQLRLVYFTARKSEITTAVKVYTGSTAAAATPTLCRIGLWSVDASGNLTLVASTANDTTLFAATSTAYPKSWSTPYSKVAGQRYAAGALVVSATTMPTFGGNSVIYSAEAVGVPVMAAALSSQSDLPASISAGSLSSSGQRIYAVIS
jgi:hypothetical protein